MKLMITTGRRPSDAQTQRARDLANALHATFIPRSTSVESQRKQWGAAAAYVVLKTREELRLGGASLYVHPGMLYLKQRDGLRHPLIRAVAPQDGVPVRSILDGTLGLAGDAIHIASVLPAVKIVGCEVSPVLHALLEEGLARLSAEHGRPWAAAAARVRPIHSHSEDYLGQMDSSSVDVIYLDPMFPLGQASTTGFDVARSFASPMAPSDNLLFHALRVARARVVMKIPGASAPPSAQPPETGWNRRIRGGSVDYLVAELELSHPEWQAPDLGIGPSESG